MRLLLTVRRAIVDILIRIAGEDHHVIAHRQAALVITLTTCTDARGISITALGIHRAAGDGQRTALALVAAADTSTIIGTALYCSYYYPTQKVECSCILGGVVFPCRELGEVVLEPVYLYRTTHCNDVTARHRHRTAITLVAAADTGTILTGVGRHRTTRDDDIATIALVATADAGTLHRRCYYLTAQDFYLAAITHVTTADASTFHSLYHNDAARDFDYSAMLMTFVTRTYASTSTKESRAIHRFLLTFGSHHTTRDGYLFKGVLAAATYSGTTADILRCGLHRAAVYPDCATFTAFVAAAAATADASTAIIASALTLSSHLAAIDGDVTALVAAPTAADASAY